MTRIVAINRAEFERDTIPTPPLYDFGEAYKDAEDTVRGGVLRDRTDDDWHWVVLGRDLNGKFRAIEFQSSIPTQDEARTLLHKAMARLAGKKVYPQGNQA